MPPAPEISIVVANWNGVPYLQAGLRSLVESARICGHQWELIVVDDASSDGSAELIQREFPEVRLFVNARNVRFAHTSNRGAREARGRIIVMVNNDVEVPLDFIQRLTAPFFEPNAKPLFAVGAKTVDMEDGTPNHLCMVPAWRRGGIGKEWCDPPLRHEGAYVQGGAAAYDRALFLQLGGFDSLFSPGYWEDYDLSYRAMKAGWRSIYEPVAVARHKGKGSLLGLLGARQLARLDERNRLWFIWLNLESPTLWLRHLAAIPWICLRDLWQGRGTLGLGGFAWALLNMRTIWHARRHRRENAPPARYSDAQLNGMVGMSTRDESLQCPKP